MAHILTLEATRRRLENVRRIIELGASQDMNVADVAKISEVSIPTAREYIARLYNANILLAHPVIRGHYQKFSLTKNTKLIEAYLCSVEDEEVLNNKKHADRLLKMKPKADVKASEATRPVYKDPLMSAFYTQPVRKDADRPSEDE